MEFVFRPFQNIVKMGFIPRFVRSPAQCDRHLQSRSLRQHLQSFAKVQRIVFHHERKAIPPFLARPAFVGLPLGIDRERWVMIVMKRTKTFENAAVWVKGYGFADQMHNVRPGTNQLFEIVGAHHDRHP